jgi:hypothetical protein
MPMLRGGSSCIVHFSGTSTVNVFAGSGLKYEATDVTSDPDTSVADFNCDSSLGSAI